MKKKLIKKLLAGRAVVLLVFAFLLISSGQAFADVPDNSVTTQKIVNRAVTTAKIATAAVKTGKIANASIGYKKVKNGAIITAKIRNQAVTNGKMADDSVDTTEIVAGAVTTAKLASNVLVLRLGSGYTAGDTAITGLTSFNTTYVAGGNEVTTTLSDISSVMIVPSKSGYVFEIDETSLTAGSFKVKVMETTSTGGPLLEVDTTVPVTDVRYQAIGQP